MGTKCVISNYPAFRITQNEPPIHCSDRAHHRSRQHPSQMLPHSTTSHHLRDTGRYVMMTPLVQLTLSILDEDTAQPRPFIEPLRRPRAPRISRQHRRQLPAHQLSLGPCRVTQTALTGEDINPPLGQASTRERRPRRVLQHIRPRPHKA